jgi:thiol-disulfide isomerase/thioredoxin
VQARRKQIGRPCIDDSEKLMMRMPKADPSSSSSLLRDRRAIMTGLMTGLAGSCLSLAAGRQARSDPRDIPSFEFGRYQFIELQPQPDLPTARLFHVDGSTILLSTLRGRPILLNFWATWCPPCRTELPVLDRLQGRHDPPAIRVLAVSVDQTDRSGVMRYIATLRLNHLQIFRDPNGYVASSERGRRNAPFMLYGMPITYLVSASGKVIGYMLGAADWNNDAGSKLLEYLERS